MRDPLVVCSVGAPSLAKERAAGCVTGQAAGCPTRTSFPSGSTIVNARPEEMELAVAVLDDQIVPLAVGRALVREPEPTVERRRRIEVSACEQRDGADHLQT